MWKAYVDTLSENITILKWKVKHVIEKNTASTICNKILNEIYGVKENYCLLDKLIELHMVTKPV